MGNKGSKTKKHPPEAATAKAEAPAVAPLSGLKGKSMREILESDELIKKLRAGVKSLDSTAAERVAFLDAVNKRANIYTSGQKCGDSKETGEEHLEQHADNIKEKFLSGNVIKAPEEMAERAKGAKGNELKCFGEVEEWVTAEVESFIGTHA